jgi:putative ABC transport system substrate-binding protein
MRRREFITLVGGAAVWPLTARAQQPPAMLRVGTVGVNPRSLPTWVAFERRMSELGYQEGRNFVFDYVRVPTADAQKGGFRELMARKPDVIVTGGPELSLKLAIAASDTTPLVMIAVDFDPLALGYVAGLARPGGRITGVFLRQIELTEKRLQFFKDTFPEMSAATVFWDSNSADQWEAAQRVSASRGVQLAGVDLGEPPFDYERALAEVPPDYRKYLFVLTSPRFFLDRKRQAEFALRQRMASMFGFREAVDAGGLLSYGPSLTGMFSRAADYVDRIARGAKPSELPIEQPTKFELVINLATAKRLGLDIPPTLLARADEVIE